MMSGVTIAGQVAAMAAATDGQPPQELMDAMAREQAELAAAGIPERIVAVGALLPDADLLDPFGAPATLHDRVGDQAAVVVLYRGGWCPPATSRCGLTSLSCFPNSSAAA